MAEGNVRQLFDRAYKHMSLGEFADAAQCFEQVIKHSGDPYASQIAEQRIRWYCVPLESVLNEIEQHELPVDIHRVLAGLFSEGTQYLDSEQQTIIQSVEGELAKLSSVTRVGCKVWIKKTIFSSLIENLAETIQQSTEPISISDWLQDQFRDSELPDSYPDEMALDIFSSALHDYPVTILAPYYGLSKRTFDTWTDWLMSYIRDVGYPVPYDSLNELLFPKETRETSSRLVLSFKGQLDFRFIEVTQGLIFLTELINLDEDSFEDIYLLHPIPLTTQQLVNYRFFPNKAVASFSRRFSSIVDHQISQNHFLCSVGESYWLSRKLENDLYNLAQAYLLNEATPQSSRAIFEKIEPNESIDRESRSILINVLNDALKRSTNVLMAGNQTWIHLESVKRVLDETYDRMIISGNSLTTEEMLAANFGRGKVFITQALITSCENILLKDGRFILETPQRVHRWRVVDAKKRDNQEVLVVLGQSHKLLTEEQIVSLLSTQQRISSPVFKLANDDRFKPFPPERWGLKEWVLINDFAYEYLLASHQALHEIAIVGLICNDKHIKRENAIFMPQEDVRFSQDSLNRWFCRHLLSSTELDLLHEEMVKYGGAGRRIDILIRQVLHKDVSATDAESKLRGDNRFLHLDNLWFSRQGSFYSVRAEDVEQIYRTLLNQVSIRQSISLKELVYQAIGHDGRLTDAEEWLKKDERFLNLHGEFWTLKNVPKPDFTRSGTKGVAVIHRDGVGSIKRADVDVGNGNLTPRQPRSKKTDPTQDIKKEYRTLSHLDILHGNLRIARMLKHWIPTDAANIQCRDEDGYDFIAYIDETGKILNIRDWLEKRGLTYGDKISIQPLPEKEGLLIQPYGTRDEGVYQDALNHQEIEKLITEAREVNKSFHDLMIEVMDAFEYPLHREDLYQLVNYQRTASRATISEILSLPDCPFEELRYFIPVGGGYWKYDAKRKEAYDMKIQELLSENNALQQRIDSLEIIVNGQRGSLEETTALSEQNELLQKTIVELNNRLENLRQEKSVSEQIATKLKDELEIQSELIKELQKRILDNQEEGQKLKTQAEEEKKQLQDEISRLANEVNSLQAKIETEHEMASLQIEEIRSVLEGKTQEFEAQMKLNSDLEDNLKYLQDDNRVLQSNVDELKAEGLIHKIRIDNALAAAKTNVQSLEKEIERLKSTGAETVNELQGKLRDLNKEKECLEREYEQLMHESKDTIMRLQLELNAANSKVASLEDAASKLSFRQIVQSFSHLLFHHKS